MLKQEEMKTWKKIEETKKRTSEIHNLKHRNEEKVQKVLILSYFLSESAWHAAEPRERENELAKQLYG